MVFMPTSPEALFGHAEAIKCGKDPAHGDLKIAPAPAIREYRWLQSSNNKEALDYPSSLDPDDEVEKALERQGALSYNECLPLLF
jgi:hypothetical protein